MDREIGPPVYVGELGWDRIEALGREGIARWLFEESADRARVWVPAEKHSNALELAEVMTS